PGATPQRSGGARGVAAATHRLGFFLGGRRRRRAAHPALRLVRTAPTSAASDVSVLPVAGPRPRRLDRTGRGVQLRGAPPSRGAGACPSIRGCPRRTRGGDA